MTNVLFFKVLDLFRHGDVEVPEPVKLDQLCGAEVIRSVQIRGKVLAEKGALDPPAEGVDRQSFSAVNEAVISVANEIDLRSSKENGLPKPFERLRDGTPVSVFVLVPIQVLKQLLLHRLVSGDRCLNTRLRHLGL